MALCKTVNGTQPSTFAKVSPDEGASCFRWD